MYYVLCGVGWLTKSWTTRMRNCGRQTAQTTDQWHSVTPRFSVMEGCCAAVQIMELSPTVHLITSICLTNDKSGKLIGRNLPNHTATKQSNNMNWSAFSVALVDLLMNRWADFQNSVVGGILTWDDHRRLSLHILLFPGALVELFLSQGNLVGLHVASLGVLRYTTRHAVKLMSWLRCTKWTGKKGFLKSYQPLVGIKAFIFSF